MKALIVACALAAWRRAACTKKDPSAAAAAAQTEASLFAVPPNQLPHLKIVEVSRTLWSSTVRTTGTVDWDADHTTQAITQVSGPISKLLVDFGRGSTAEQPLLYVSSPDVATRFRLTRRRAITSTIPSERWIEARIFWITK